MKDRSKRSWPTWLAIFLTANLVLAGGCNRAGPKLVIVRGVVKFNGRPLQRGLITFQPVDTDGKGTSSRTSIGVIAAGGNYTMSTFSTGDGVMPGKYLASVDGGLDAAGADTSIDLADQKPAAARPSPIPVKYLSPQSSGLTATVPDSATAIDLDFDLTP